MINLKTLIAAGSLAFAAAANAQWTYDYPVYSPGVGIALTSNGAIYVGLPPVYHTPPRYYAPPPPPVYVRPPNHWERHDYDRRREWERRNNGYSNRRDSDRDGVPNRYDYAPNNPYRR